MHPSLRIGENKGKIKPTEGEVAGYWTSQLPPEIDWKEYQSRGPIDKYKHTVGGQYDWLRKRKDSMIIKNNLATRDDHAAWFFIQHAVPALQADPTQRYLIPKRKDGTYVDEEPASAPPAANAAPVNAPSPVTPFQPPPVTPPAQAPMLAPPPQIPAFSPQVAPSFFAPNGSKPSAPAPAPMNFTTPALIGGAALIAAAFIFSRRKGR